MSEHLTVVAVIELETSDYEKESRPWPGVSRYEDPEAWEKYWHNSLEDSGLRKVRQMEPGVPLVDITRIDEDELHIITRVQLGQEHLTDQEQMDSFHGGVFISYGGMSVWPQCCSALSDYKEWQEVLKSKPSEWTQIWVGHPWIFVRILNGRIEFSDYYEKNDYAGKAMFSVDLREFELQFSCVLQEIESFISRVDEAVLKIRGEEKRKD